ncbi:MAG: hypothetical protein Kow00133_14500 [Amphiplicatus sp.]
MIQLINIVAPSALAGACVLAAALLVNPKLPCGDRSQGLAVFLILIAFSAIEDLAIAAGLHQRAPHLLGVSWPFAMLKGPAIYAYVAAMTRPTQPEYGPRHLLALGWPFLLGLVLATPFYLLDASAKLAFMAGGESALFDARTAPALGALGVICLSLVIAFGYLVVSFRLLRRHMRRVRDLFSNIEDKTLNWLRWVLLILLAAWIWGAADSSGSLLGVAPVWQEAAASFLELGWVGALAYFGILQRPIFPSRTPAGVPQRKYGRSALDSERMERIAEKLNRVMQDEKLFRNPSLSLRDLSDRLSVSENYLSQTLNEKLGRNFFDFVNAWRVDEAKRLLRENDGPVLAIALEVGFNSRSTFNAAFKKHGGGTPSQFRADARAARPES